MRRYILTGAQADTHVPAHPERTASRACVGIMNFDREFREWPSRGAMLQTIAMQERREPHPRDWRACRVPGV